MCEQTQQAMFYIMWCLFCVKLQVRKMPFWRRLKAARPRRRCGPKARMSQRTMTATMTDETSFDPRPARTCMGRWPLIWWDTEIKWCRCGCSPEAWDIYWIIDKGQIWNDKSQVTEHPDLQLFPGGRHFIELVITDNLSFTDK